LRVGFWKYESSFTKINEKYYPIHEIISQKIIIPEK
jgi:hypothetical protein